MRALTSFMDLARSMGKLKWKDKEGMRGILSFAAKPAKVSNPY